MFYRSTTTPASDSILVDNLSGSELQASVKHLVEQIVEDNQKKIKPLCAESLVISIQGSWGVGKTFTCWALINYLRTRAGFNAPDKLHVFSFELLPFGNINESIANILGYISDNLWNSGLVDIRNELNQMAIDATPTKEMNAGVTIFGISLSRKIVVSSRYKNNKFELRKKLRSLCEDGHRFLIMLDDLDRLKPHEVVAITRMIENFKDIPGIVFLLPFNRDAVAGAIQASLKLNEASSHVFLRKFIKASLSIEQSIDDLKHSFINEFQNGENDDANTAILNHFGVNCSELAWYVLVHIIVVRETLGAIGTDHSSKNVNANYNNNEESSYLFKLAQYLSKAKNPKQNPETNSLPFINENKFKRWAEVYGYLSDQGNFEQTFSQLGLLLNEEMMTNDIYTSSDLVDALRNKAEIDLERDAVNSMNKKMVFELVMLPLIKESANEPKLTNNYSRRDMQQLSNSIWRDPEFEIIEDPKEFLKKLLSITRKRFKEFR